MAKETHTGEGAGEWEGWQPNWQRRKKSPHALQERHSPTLRPAEGAAARRITDARLWEAMTPSQQEAAREITLAYEILSRGIGYTLTDWERLPGAKSHNAVEWHEKLVGGYALWAKNCREKNISHSLAIDILVFGFSCRALDRDTRTRTGHAKRNLLRALFLYCRMKGWPAE